MPKLKLTMDVCKRATCSAGKNQEDYRDTEVVGLSLRVSKAGSKKWTLLYRYAGRERRHTFGNFAPKGDRRGIDLKTAREKAIALQADLIDGVDIGAKANEGGDTVADLLQSHINILKNKGRRPAYTEDIRP